MIDHWLSDDGRKAIEKMGWPEFVTATGITYVISSKGETFGVSLCDGMERMEYGTIANSVALALLRDHAREWLMEHGPDECPLDNDDSQMIAAILATEEAE